MAIVQDYAGIAAELRRIQAERRAREGRVEPVREETRPTPAPRHPMRATIAGERLYRRLISPGRR